ncbi:glycoprotein hormone beta-5 [Brachyhypopomus gauderio]|uniref:glycoprotein hormone beta-5 n=1 Tax=Brachyhypopomus gauderio TaxID=698409 RepID=UPI0040413C4A
MAFWGLHVSRFSLFSLCGVAWTVWLCAGGGASGVDLRSFTGCAVREFSFTARKPGCKGLHITTDACWGRCETWEKPVLDPPFIESHQQVCTYNETQVVTVELPNCAEGVDPRYSYPVALRCDCGLCATTSTECITSA